MATLGRITHDVKPLGFGAMRLPTLSRDMTDIDLEQVKQMVDVFMDAGFNYFDTAYMYHQSKSEGAVREALVERYPRDRFLLADKLPTYILKEEAQCEEIFQTQLDRLGVRHLDFYLLHGMDGSKLDSMKNIGAYDYMRKLKKEGRATYIGFSFHDTPEVLADLLDNYFPDADFVQLQLNYMDWKGQRADEQYEICTDRGIPVIVMEPIKGGALANFSEELQKPLLAEAPDMSMASWAMRYCASLPNALTTLSGMSTLAQVEDNVATFKDLKLLTDAQKETLYGIAEKLMAIETVPCTACKYCADCPQSIDIPEMMERMNDIGRFGASDGLKNGYRNFVRVKADACIECGVCESVCPQHIEIIETLKRVHEALA